MERPVLVTGASGFIGRHLARALRTSGQRVRALVRRPEDAAALEIMGAEPVVGDLLQFEPRSAHGIRGVYHLAGRLFSPGVPPSYYERLHVEATSALFEAAAQNDSIEFFLHCSTTGVHGPTVPGMPAREEDPGHPGNAYEETKARAEVAVRAQALRHRVPAIIARPGLVYGPGDLHLAGWFRAIQSGYYRVIGSGSNHLHPIFIDDLVVGLRLAVARAAPACPAYHLVGASAVTMRELSDAIGAALGRKVPSRHLSVRLARGIGAALEMLPVRRSKLPLTRSRVAFMIQNREYDGSKARADLGFVPEVGLQDGLSRTVAWYRANHLL